MASDPATRYRGAPTVPRDLTIDQHELDFRYPGDPRWRLYPKPFPIESSKEEGGYYSGEGRAICRARTSDGKWWLVVEIYRDTLGYIPEQGLETKQAKTTFAQRNRQPSESRADATDSVDATWSRCGPWKGSECTVTYTLAQQSNRVCGYYSYIGINGRIFAGQIAGHRHGNRIDVEYICGRPGLEQASHWCPEQDVGDGNGWDKTAKPLFLCEGRLYPDGGDCTQQRVENGLERHAIDAKVQRERTDASWLSKCLADDKFPPTHLMAPSDSPIKY
jgi:hypothetical protein